MTAHPGTTWFRCLDCGAGYYPHQRACSACGGWDRLTAEPLPRTGRLFTWTVIHVGPVPPPMPPPYALGYADLDDGPRVLAPIACADPERDLAHGDRLVLVPHEPEATVPFHLEPVG